VGTNVVRKRTMTAVDVRQAAKILVEREEIRSQSRMLAYEHVGQMVGASGMWVRRFVKGYEGCGLNYPIAANILAQYHSICTRIEANTEGLRRDNDNADRQIAMGEPQGEAAPTSQFLPPLDL
jgi:hypothetical protein